MTFKNNLELILSFNKTEEKTFATSLSAGISVPISVLCIKLTKAVRFEVSG